MVMFFADMAFALELIAVGFGFWLLYLFGKEKAQALRWGAMVLLIGGFLGLACTSFYTFKYWFQGEFHSAHPHMQHGEMMHQNGMMDKDHMMQKGKMMEGSQNNEMPNEHKH